MHTPGPWAAHEQAARIVVGPADGPIIADCSYRHDDGEDNARLIAAAPDLLSTLRDILADCDDVDDGKMTTVSAASLTRARQAVAKAEG